MIHANGHTMLVSREGLTDAIDRIGYLYGGPTGFRGLSVTAFPFSPCGRRVPPRAPMRGVPGSANASFSAPLYQFAAVPGLRAAGWAKWSVAERSLTCGGGPLSLA